MSYERLYRDIQEQSGGSLLQFNFEGLIRDLYVSVLRPGDWALDIGANEGVHTVQMAQAVSPGGRVIAVEAVPALADGIRDSIERNHPHLRDSIDLRTCGVSNAEGRAKFHYCPDLTGCSGLRMRGIIAGHEVQEIDVDLTTIDHICAGAEGRISFMKIDIEGAEYDAVRGAARTIDKHLPVITFEHNYTSPQDFGYSVEQMIDLWHGLCYGVYDLFGNCYSSVDQFHESMVWDYLAVPWTLGRTKLQGLFGVGREALAKAGIAAD